MFPAGSPVKPKTVGDNYMRPAVMASANGVSATHHSAYRPNELQLPTAVAVSPQSRQYSIPASTVFHDGNNDTLVTGSSIALFNKVANNSNNESMTMINNGRRY